MGRLSILILMALACTVARSDWINLTGAEAAPNVAEITVLNDRVHIALEVYIGDLDTFEALVPDDWLKSSIPQRLSLPARLQKFSENTLQVITDDGEKLRARLTLVEPRIRKDRASLFAGVVNPLTRQRAVSPPDDKRVLYAELEYPFSNQPESLTFVPPRNESGDVIATVGFIAYHNAVPVTDFRFLSKASTVILDWKDPWYTRFENRNLKRHHESAFMTFLYVEPREVRHEMILRVQDLQRWTDLGLAGNTELRNPDLAQIKELAGSFLSKRNPVTVDGQTLAPRHTRSEFLEVSLTGLRVIEDDRSLDMSTALLGVILSYPVRHLPDHITVDWELFNERVQQIPATATDPAGPFLSFIEPDQPVLEWRNFLRQYQEPEVQPVIIDDGRSIGIPLLTVLSVLGSVFLVVLAARPKVGTRSIWLVAAGVGFIAAWPLSQVAILKVGNPFSGPPDDEVSVRILTGVLTNINHAYLETEPGELDRSLELVSTEEAFQEVRQELDRALSIRVQSGGIARVHTVEEVALKEVNDLKDRPGFRSIAEWTAHASASHWGHTHRRSLRFRALVELVDSDGSWKLDGITVVDTREVN